MMRNASPTLLSAFLAAAAAVAGCNIAPGDIPPRNHEAIVPPPPAPATPPSEPLPGGGLFSAGNGYIIGQLPDKTNRAEAEAAGKQGQQTPASPQQARQSATADLNKDGFVTMDELVAMRDAGLDDQEMIRRLEATGQVFQVTANQEDFLISRGVSRAVLDRLHRLSPPSAPVNETTTSPTSRPR